MNNLEPNIDPEGRKKFPLEHLPPRIFIVLTLFVVFFTYQILGGILSASFIGIDDIMSGGKIELTRLFTAFSQYMFILFPVLLLSYLQGNNPRDAFKLKKPNIPILLLSVIGIVAILPSIEAFVYFQEKLLYSLPLGDEVLNGIREFDDQMTQLTVKLAYSYSLPEMLVVVFVIAVTPAICEEFFFRGLILKNFERSSRAFSAILYTGVLFAIFHFHPLNLIPLVFLGFFLTYVVHYSGSIYTGIICHFVNNGLAVVGLYYMGPESMDKTVIAGQDEVSIIVYGIVSLVVIIIIMKTIKKIAQINDKKLLPGNPLPPADE
ncbi:MAG TPA: type II CAAX endopeptidase family protein [Ignavibacteria bacterium]|nr:type II CAAX endopeptidase family protein [Ignavibacteria bacterium]